MDNKSSLDEDKFNELKTAFHLFDKDHDGSICKEELMKTFRDLGHVCTEEDIDEIYNLYNCNETGIDYETFLEIATAKRFSRGKLDSDLTEAFKIFDRENQNYISRGDLEYVLKNFCNTLNEKEIAQMIKEVDENGDGNISFEEFIAMVMMK